MELSCRDSRCGSLCSCLKLTSMCFDRHHDYSIKSSSRSARVTTSRVHHLTLTTPHWPLHCLSTISHWPLHCLLKNYTNKARLNALICDQVLSENEFSAESQVSCYRGQVRAHANIWKTPRVDMSSKRKEADIFLTQQAIHVAKEDPESRALVVLHWRICFVTVGYFYWSEKLQSTIRLLCSHQLKVALALT